MSIHYICDIDILIEKLRFRINENLKFIIILVNLRLEQMKKIFSILAIAGAMMIGNIATANTTVEAAAVTTTVEATAVEALQDQAAEAPVVKESFHQELKKRFIEGGPEFMGIVLICLILGLAIAIERIIFLNLSTTSTKKLTQNVEDALASGGVDAAKEVCRNTKGPVASIFYQGLDRADEDIDAAERAVVAMFLGYLYL